MERAKGTDTPRGAVASWAAVRALPAGEVYAALRSRPEGLTREEARERLARVGPNAIREADGTSLVVSFLAQFTHLMALLLWAGGIVAFAAGLPHLGLAIWTVNLINGVFSFWQEFRAKRETQALRRILPAAARVMRDGLEVRVPAEDLVPGDVLLLSEGDRVSADARLVREAELGMDQSTLSGEAHPVRKSCNPAAGAGLRPSEEANAVFAGTSVATGRGTAVVFATGMETAFGRIARLTLSLPEEKSPLQREMERVTRLVTVIAVGAGALLFGLAVLLGRMTPAEGFVFALGMIVAFVPEGLLPTVSLALAMGVRRMARRRALVKRLSAVETLGCTSVICTDKTGTLTENEMTVRAVFAGGLRFEATGTGYAPEGRILGKDPLPDGAAGCLERLLRAAALCNDARLVPPGNAGERWTATGDPTEAALAAVAAKGGIDLAAERRIRPRLSEFPFDSRRRRMTTVHEDGGGRIVYAKGAPLDLAALCVRVALPLREDPLTPAAWERIAEEGDAMAREGLRVLAVAERALPAEGPLPGADEAERGLTFLGLLGMMDPPRPGVAEAVATCHRAGIRIVMVTGDYGLTAENIARRLGILRGGSPRIVDGAEMDAMGDEELRKLLRGEVILARAAPEHKLRAVAALQAEGDVVAVTGDGVNDAPALKKADIGIAMGLSGTDVAREAADIVLTDDNFASIVSAVEEGRAVYANIRKFMTYIFTSNMPEAVPFVLFAFSGGRIPPALNVMQVLSVDLGTDIVPALALGVEPPEPGIMDRPPRKLSEHAISLSMLLRAYPFLGLIQSAAAMGAFYFCFWTNGYAGRWLDLPGSGDLYRAASAMTLGAVAVTQVGNLFAQRTEGTSVFRAGFFANRLIGAGIVADIALLLAIVYVPFLQDVFGTSGIPPLGWAYLLAVAPALLVADLARKAILVRFGTRGGRPGPRAGNGGVG